LLLTTLGFDEVDAAASSVAAGMCMTGCDAVAIGAGAEASPIAALAPAGSAEIGEDGVLIIGGATFRVDIGAAVLGTVSTLGAGVGEAATDAGGVIAVGAAADMSVVCASTVVEEKARTAAIAVRPGRSGDICLFMPDQPPARG
jgi:hypothetical protein